MQIFFPNTKVLVFLDMILNGKILLCVGSNFCIKNKKCFWRSHFISFKIKTNTEFSLFSWQKFVQIQVILFEIDCAIFYTNSHELFCQFISWTNWVNSGKFMDNCWISCQVMADKKKVYDDLIIINLYQAVSSKSASISTQRTCSLV